MRRDSASGTHVGRGGAANVAMEGEADDAGGDGENHRAAAAVMMDMLLGKKA